MDHAAKAAEKAKAAEQQFAEARTKAIEANKALERTKEAKASVDAAKTKEKEAAKAAATAERDHKMAEAKAKAASDVQKASAGAKPQDKTRLENEAKSKQADVIKGSEAAKTSRAQAERIKAEAVAAAKTADEKVKAAGIGNLPLEKPLMTQTPGGQKLSPGVPVTDNVKTVGHPGRPWTGAAGNVRNNGDKRHAGLDEKAKEAKYTMPGEGKVTVATMHPRLGGYVTVETKSPDGKKVEVTTMHMEKVTVKAGDTVRNGDKIGEGMGAGTIFKEPGASEEHIHSEFRINGHPVEPYSGKELPFNGEADVTEARRAATRANEAARQAERKAVDAKAAAEKEALIKEALEPKPIQPPAP